MISLFQICAVELRSLEMASGPPEIVRGKVSMVGKNVRCLSPTSVVGLRIVYEMPSSSTARLIKRVGPQIRLDLRLRQQLCPQNLLR